MKETTMATTTKIAATPTRPTFDYEVTAEGRGYNLPQTMGRRLWAPMLAVALQKASSMFCAA